MMMGDMIMRNFRKIFIMLMLLLVLLAPVSMAADGSYTLPNAEETITVLDDATTVVQSNITYSITGSVNGVSKIIVVDGQQSVSNITVETPGYYNKVEVINESKQVMIKVWLYKDESKTEKVSDCDVNVIYRYNFNKGVKVYNDVAELQYMSWGSGWTSGVDSLTTHIIIPQSNENTEYWNNPSTYVEDSKWTTSNELTTHYKNIPEKTSAEQRIIMPKEYIKNTENADVINKDAKQIIENDQREYASKEASGNNILLIVSAIFMGLVLAPIGMFLKWGRNPEIIYDADYESQIPTNDSPVFVNAMIPGIVGEVDVNAFLATLLDLIDRKYYKMVISNEEDTIIRRLNRDVSSLKLHETDIIDFLSGYENEKQQISLNSIKQDTYNTQKFVNAWKIDAYREVPSGRIKQYYDSSKETIMSGYNILAIFLGVAFLLYSGIFATGPFKMIATIISVILIIEQLAIFFFIDSPLGHWTGEGKEFHDKWKNFEKYIKDFSLIKERPPESIQVWGRYLVYATALGCAEEVSRNMKKYIKYYDIPDTYIDEFDLISLAYFTGFYHMHSTFHNAMHDPDMGSAGVDLGSFGDIGGPGSGGFGGGGGGVF